MIFIYLYLSHSTQSTADSTLHPVDHERPVLEEEFGEIHDADKDSAMPEAICSISLNTVAMLTSKNLEQFNKQNKCVSVDTPPSTSKESGDTSSEPKSAVAETPDDYPSPMLPEEGFQKQSVPEAVDSASLNTLSKLTMVNLEEFDKQNIHKYVSDMETLPSASKESDDDASLESKSDVVETCADYLLSSPTSECSSEFDQHSYYDLDDLDSSRETYSYEMEEKSTDVLNKGESSETDFINSAREFVSIISDSQYDKKLGFDVLENTLVDLIIGTSVNKPGVRVVLGFLVFNKRNEASKLLLSNPLLDNLVAMDVIDAIRIIIQTFNVGYVDPNDNSKVIFHRSVYWKHLLMVVLKLGVELDLSNLICGGSVSRSKLSEDEDLKFSLFDSTKSPKVSNECTVSDASKSFFKTGAEIVLKNLPEDVIENIKEKYSCLCDDGIRSVVSASNQLIELALLDYFVENHKLLVTMYTYPSRNTAGSSKHAAGSSKNDAGISENDAGISKNDSGSSKNDAASSENDAASSEHSAGSSEYGTHSNSDEPVSLTVSNSPISDQPIAECGVANSVRKFKLHVQDKDLKAYKDVKFDKLTDCQNFMVGNIVDTMINLPESKIYPSIIVG